MEKRFVRTQGSSRLVFNVLIGNTDDHARNHSFFVEGASIRLTPACDVTLLPRGGSEAGHGMKITRLSNLSRIRLCLNVVFEFGLSEEEGRAIVEHPARSLRELFDTLCEEAGMTTPMRERFRGRAVLNPYVFARCKELNPVDWEGSAKGRAKSKGNFIPAPFSTIEPSSEGSHRGGWKERPQSS